MHPVLKVVRHVSVLVFQMNAAKATYLLNKYQFQFLMLRLLELAWLIGIIFPYMSKELLLLYLIFRYQRERISNGFLINSAMNEIGYTFPPSSRRQYYYWSLPRQLTGNQITSYGGRLEFSQRYTQRPQSSYFPDQDIIIMGNGVTIYWTNPQPQQEEISNVRKKQFFPTTSGRYVFHAAKICDRSNSFNPRGKTCKYVPREFPFHARYWKQFLINVYIKCCFLTLLKWILEIIMLIIHCNYKCVYIKSL